MKHYLVVIPMLLTISLAAVLLSGCQFQASFGIGDFVTGESYPNAASYQTGAFTYRADEVTAVEVYWHCGEVEIIESDEDELRVCESGGELSEETAMHYFLKDGTLRVRFCESGVQIRVSSNDKRLTIEVPKGIDLSVHTTSAPIKADALEQKSVLFSARSGRTEVGTVTADSVDLSSSSGSIRVDTIKTKSLKCSTSSGSVGIDDLETETADIETTSGAVELGLSTASQIEVHTTSGKTNLRLPEGGAEVAYRATSGKLQTTVPFDQKGDLYVFGNGESQIKVVSTSGNLVIQPFAAIS